MEHMQRLDVSRQGWLSGLISTDSHRFDRGLNCDITRCQLDLNAESRSDHHWNHKRVYQAALNFRIRPHGQIHRHRTEPAKLPVQQNQIWSMGYTHDQLPDRHHCRPFNVIVDYCRKGLTLEASFSCPQRTFNNMRLGGYYFTITSNHIQPTLTNHHGELLSLYFW